MSGVSVRMCHFFTIINYARIVIMFTFAKTQSMEEQKEETGLVALKRELNKEGVKKRFADILGNKSAGFLATISTVAANNELLQKADISSILLCAGQAAALDLPIVPNLGYAALVPYFDNKKRKNIAQFQIMRDGWVELLMRTGQVQTVVNEVVHEGEFVSQNRFRGEYVFDESKRTSDKIIGYMAYVRLLNGFEKTVYWTYQEVQAHAYKYSQTLKSDKEYVRKASKWATDFDAMALKTVLKHLIKKYCPKSAEMQKALTSDQASFTGTLDNLGDATPEYVDNEVEDVAAQEVETIDPDKINNQPTK